MEHISNIARRVLSLVLAFCMCLSLCAAPMQAAEVSGGDASLMREVLPDESTPPAQEDSSEAESSTPYEEDSSVPAEVDADSEDEEAAFNKEGTLDAPEEEEVMDVEAEAEADPLVEELEGDAPTFNVTHGSDDKFGSGSAMLNENPNDYRFYAEGFYSKTDSYATATAGIQRRNEFYVYLNEGETVLFGSSVDNSCLDKNHKLQERKPDNYLSSTLFKWTNNKKTVTKTLYTTGADIVMTRPNSSKTVETFDVIKGGAGYIANHNQELYGPKLNPGDAGDAKRYQPLSYTAQESGIHTFVFHSVVGANDGSTPPPRLSSAQWDQINNTIAAWDITVVGKNSTTNRDEVKSGRAWTKLLALTTGGASDYTAQMNLHILTNDGYTYKVDFEDLVPWGFLFFSNNMGFTTTDKIPYSIYHSFYDNDNNLDKIDSELGITTHNPQLPDNSMQETYKIFFNKPNEDLPATVMARPTGATGTISNLTFRGFAPNTARYGQGGTFSFYVDNATSLSLTIDFRDTIKALQVKPGASNEIKNYSGSGIVELDGSVVPGKYNTFPWDGTDTTGEYIPVGEYGDTQNSISVKVTYEAKNGEIHFPLIDVEGLRGGVQIERLPIDGQTQDGTNGVYDLYYNNNPLVYGNFEGKPKNSLNKVGKHYTITRSTKSYDAESDSTKAGAPYFYSDDLKSISTLVKDESSGTLADTYHHVPVNTHKTDANHHTMKFKNTGNNGGGNQAGVDMWTYYVTGSNIYQNLEMNMAIVAEDNTETIEGTVFYDQNKNGQRDRATNSNDGTVYQEEGIDGMRVHLVDGNGDPITHMVEIPDFDEDGFFRYDERGEVIYKLTRVEFSELTANGGHYTFSSVPVGGTYYVQTLLNDVQVDLLRYVCTTNKNDAPSDEYGPATIPKVTVNGNTVDASGGDGNLLYKDSGVPSGLALPSTWPDVTPVMQDGKTIFNQARGQSLTLVKRTNDTAPAPSFKDIGYVTAVPEENQFDYKVVKHWKSAGDAAAVDHTALDGITVELYRWNSESTAVGSTGSSAGVNQRQGDLIDTVKLAPSNKADENWTHTWKHLDNRESYYIVEYYTKHDEDGNPMTNDRDEERLVLIGTTLPAYHSAQFAETSGHVFKDTDGKLYYGNSNKNPLAEWFNDEKTHVSSLTEEEKQTTLNTDARLYDMTYTLTQDVSNKLNTITITNDQTYDEQTYYVWLNHETELPDFISKTLIQWKKDENGQKTGEKEKIIKADKMSKCEETGEGHSHHGNTDHIVGLTITSLDAGQGEGTGNEEGNSTDSFRFDSAHPKNVYFTATDDIYKSGTGTRTYMVEYVVKRDSNGKPVMDSAPEEPSPVPVPVHPGSNGDLLDSTNQSVYNNPKYIVYTWTLTIHVFDLNNDDVFSYNPAVAADIPLQKGLPQSELLNWTYDKSSLHYYNDDERSEEENGILGNDTYRVPLYKNTVHDLIGTCADLVGVAYSEAGILHDDTAVAALPYADADTKTIEQTAGDAARSGNNVAVSTTSGTLSVSLNTLLSTKIDRGQDHLNYANMTFTPNVDNAATATTDTFYYKVAVLAEDMNHVNVDYDAMDARKGVVMYAYFQTEPVGAELVGATLTVSNQIDMNFYVGGIDSVEKATSYYMSFTDEYGQDLLGGDAAEEDKVYVDGHSGKLALQGFESGRNLTITANDKTYYGYTFQHLTPYEMSEKITATLYYHEPGDEGGRYIHCGKVTYSVEDYARTVLDDVNTNPENYADDTIGNNTEKLRSMLVDMVNYGSAAQEYAVGRGWIEHPGTEPNEFIRTESIRERADRVTADMLKKYEHSSTHNEGGIFTNVGIGLTMDVSMDLNLVAHFTVNSNDLPNYSLVIHSDVDDNLSYTDKSGKLYNKDASGNLTIPGEDFTKDGERAYSVIIGGVPPFFWGYSYEMYFVKKNTTTKVYDLLYSVNSYCYNKVLENSDDYLTRLVKAMFRFNQSADVWFGSNEASSEVYNNPGSVPSEPANENENEDEPQPTE